METRGVGGARLCNLTSVSTTEVYRGSPGLDRVALLRLRPSQSCEHLLREGEGGVKRRELGTSHTRNPWKDPPFPLLLPIRLRLQFW